MRPIEFVAAVLALGLSSCVVYREEPTAAMSERERELAFYSTGPAPGPTPPAAGTGDAEASPPQGPPRSDGEVCAVREAIVAALRASVEPWAAPIAERTAGAPCAVEPDGSARIGAWSLRACVEGCESLQSFRFVWREPEAQTPSYAAEVVREASGGFRCTLLGRYLVQPR
jgi:hypothetical protein